MFRHILKTTARQLSRNRLYSAINLVGLMSSLAAVILIGLFVRDELGYDKWIPNADNIYRADIVYSYPGRDDAKWSSTPGELAASLQREFPQIADAARVYRDEGLTVRLGTESFDEVGFFVDEGYFRIFDLPLVAGDHESALATNSGVLISESMAQKYFAGQNPVGQTMSLDPWFYSESDYVVAGVFKDIPENTHFDTDFIGLFDEGKLREGGADWIANWTSVSAQTYLRIADTASANAIGAGLSAFSKKMSEANVAAPETIAVSLVNLQDIHLHTSDMRGQQKAPGDAQIVTIFSIVAVLILVVAAINFTNLATAQAIKRAKELGLRKVFGAKRSQLVAQFIGEAALTTFIALWLAVIVVEIVLPFFNEMVGKELALSLLSDPALLGGLLFLSAFTAFLGSAYPAFLLSGYQPASMLKRGEATQVVTPWLSKALMVVQFSISIALIAVTAVVYAQTIYARTIDTGIDKADKVSFFVGNSEIRQTLAQELLNVPGVTAVSTANRTWPLRGISDTRMIVQGKAYLTEVVRVAPDYLSMFDVAPLAGRIFSYDRPGDFLTRPEDDSKPVTRGIVVNESFLRQTGLGSPEEAVNSIISQDADWLNEVTIVGVIPDLKTRSVMEKPSPTAYFVSEAPLRVMTMDVAEGQTAEALEGLNAVWSQLQPGEPPLSPTFMDDRFDALYDSQTEIAQMFAGFSLFAGFVACLGLYGLAAFNAERRTLEIGVRKVMGASVLDIVKLLVVQFSKPVLLGNLIAWPAVGFLMSEWLQGFVFRLDSVFIAAALAGAATVALLIAWLTVTGVAVRVGSVNPIHALRYE